NQPCRYWLSDFLVRRVLAHRCASQRIWFTRFKLGPQAHRPLRFIWKNAFDPWAAPNFREAQLWTLLRTSFVSLPKFCRHLITAGRHERLIHIPIFLDDPRIGSKDGINIFKADELRLQVVFDAIHI